MGQLKEERAMDDSAAMAEGIARLFGAANMPLLADESLYAGIPLPALAGIHEALSEQRTDDDAKKFRNRMRYAGILKERTSNTFKWDDGTYPLVGPGLIEQALTIGFVRQRKNLIMAGPPGAGKSLLAAIIACKAIREGFSVKYKTAHDISVELREARSGNSLSGYIKKMQAYDLLVIEDITFSAPEIKTAQAFFSIIDKRYARKSTIITTNGNVKEWAGNFPDKSMFAALLGRIYEEALLLNMNGAVDMRLRLANDALGGDAAIGAMHAGGGSFDA
ncbi:MAG: ATP-binding protein [Oscillospiraceae bacterium]|nr:ATP-binding protein [Oscillospiraceae bacterium]